MEVVVTGGEDYVVGCRLAIKTTLGDDIEGTVLAYDSSSKIVVLHILSFFSPLLQLASECCSCSSFRILLSNFGGRCGSPSQDCGFVEP
jgi:hypothetical protein